MTPLGCFLHLTAVSNVVLKHKDQTPLTADKFRVLNSNILLFRVMSQLMNWVILHCDTSPRSRGLFWSAVSTGEQKPLGREVKSKTYWKLHECHGSGRKMLSRFCLPWEYLHRADPLFLKKLYHSTTEKTVGTKYRALFWQSHDLNSAFLMGFLQFL